MAVPAPRPSRRAAARRSETGAVLVVLLLLLLALCCPPPGRCRPPPPRCWVRPCHHPRCERGATAGAGSTAQTHREQAGACEKYDNVGSRKGMSSDWASLSVRLASPSVSPTPFLSSPRTYRPAAPSARRRGQACQLLLPLRLQVPGQPGLERLPGLLAPDWHVGPTSAFNTCADPPLSTAYIDRQC